MNRADIEAALHTAETQLDAGEWRPMVSGFWRAVAATKAQPAHLEAFAPRIAALDRRAFLAGVLVAVPVAVGTTVMTAATVGAALVAGTAGILLRPWDVLAFAAATATLLVTTHGLAHLIAGKLTGIRFTHWFIARITRPQPGVKTDYETYLRAAPRARAWMHASGALTTKAVPFLLLAPAVAAGLGPWVVSGLLAVGLAQIATDALWSVTASDWKKFRREMAYDR